MIAENEEIYLRHYKFTQLFDSSFRRIREVEETYDVLIVGAGLFGAVCAHQLVEGGFRCLVIEKRTNIGGNCYTEVKDGISVHKYGPHIFHTSDKRIWDWINQFATFNHYRHRVRVNVEGRIYSFPINLMTFHEVWGIRTPREAMAQLERVRIQGATGDDLESWIQSHVGRELYELFIKGYTEKQWNKNPAELPSSIIRRIPIRFTYDDGYFEDPFQGIPIGGYTPIFEKLLSGVDVMLGTDYFDDRPRFDSIAKRTLYTGPIDRFLEYRLGKLEYRSIRFEHERLDIPDFQGIAQMNYPSAQIPYTRTIEHKHFTFGKQPVTWITREYPVCSTQGEDEMYPLRDRNNIKLFSQYLAICKSSQFRRFYFGGRLAEYQYYDMHQIIAAALNRSAHIANDLIASALPGTRDAKPHPADFTLNASASGQK